MSAADEAWLRMDNPHNRMVVTAVMLTAQPVSIEALRELIRVRLLRHARFRLPLVRSRASDLPRASPVELAQQVKVASSPAPWTEEALLRFVGELMQRPLPLERPWWSLYLVERYGGGSALVWRVHHAIGDGMALLRVLLDAVDEPPSEVRLSSPPARRHSSLRLVVGSTLSFARLVLLPKDHRSALRGRLSGEKRVAWSGPFSVDRVKEIARRDGATVNDVLTSALAGALHRYLASHGGAPREVRAIVPYDLRGGAVDQEQLGNRFGLVFLPLPTGPATATERLAGVQRRMARLKRSPEARVAYRLVQLIGRLSAGLSAWVIRLFARKASLVLTNVPGPASRLTLGGAALELVHFWVPQAATLGLGASLLSYAGEVRLGIAADAARVSDPQRVVEAFTEELHALAGEGSE